MLATVLFTDIVDSTAKARPWATTRGETCATHDRIVRANLARYRGREIKTMGDGFLATFDGPARGVRVRRDDRGGGAAARDRDPRRPPHRRGRRWTATTSRPRGGDRRARRGDGRASEVLVSQTVKDLVAGSGLMFEDAGEHELKGVPDRWHLYRVVD